MPEAIEDVFFAFIERTLGVKVPDGADRRAYLRGYMAGYMAASKLLIRVVDRLPADPPPVKFPCSICGKPSTVRTVTHGLLCDECAGEPT